MYGRFLRNLAITRVVLRFYLRVEPQDHFVILQMGTFTNNMKYNPGFRRNHLITHKNVSLNSQLIVSLFINYITHEIACI